MNTSMIYNCASKLLVYYILSTEPIKSSKHTLPPLPPKEEIVTPLKQSF